MSRLYCNSEGMMMMDLGYRAPCTLYELIIEHSLEDVSSYGGWYGGDKYNRNLNSSGYIPNSPYMRMGYGGYGDEVDPCMNSWMDRSLGYYKICYDLMENKDE